jgi:hypothetical protein
MRPKDCTRLQRDINAAEKKLTRKECLTALEPFKRRLRKCVEKELKSGIPIKMVWEAIDDVFGDVFNDMFRDVI